MAAPHQQSVLSAELPLASPVRMSPSWRCQIAKYTSGFYALYRGLRDGVGSVANVMFQMRAVLLGKGGRNRPSILQMYNIGTAGESRYDYKEYTRKVPHARN